MARICLVIPLGVIMLVCCQFGCSSRSDNSASDLMEAREPRGLMKDTKTPCIQSRRVSDGVEYDFSENGGSFRKRLHRSLDGTPAWEEDVYSSSRSFRNVEDEQENEELSLYYYFSQKSYRVFYSGTDPELRKLIRWPMLEGDYGSVHRVAQAAIKRIIDLRQR
jgi:hypothetical protein